MKKCSCCKVLKEVVEYGKNIKRKDGLQTYCKECSKERAKKQYRDDVHGHREKTKLRKKEVRHRNREIVWEYFKNHPCVDCGETDPLVLEFDHQRDKVDSVSMIAGGGSSTKKLLDEIAKCEVRCANCHRRKTARDFGWYKDFLR
jgi:hypothetical protein